MTHNCRKCDVPLVIGENVTQHRMGKHDYICRKCQREYQRGYKIDWCHRTGRQQPMNVNKECASFLGVHIAEQVLASVFKNVQRMPYGNPGFDFRCGEGYLIDAKCSCRCHHLSSVDNWVFNIKKNQIAEYFLCLAFDNRKDLNPEHVWLIPATDINDRIGVGISETRLEKWEQYEQPLDKVMACCNILKEK